MKVVIAGCGMIGETIIADLVKENNDITVIDSDPMVVKEMNDIYDVMGVEGIATHYETLIEANVQKADFFVAITPSDEMNMLACFIAKKLGARHATARIRNVEYNNENLIQLRSMMNIHSLNPDRLAASEFYHLLKLPAAVHVESYAQNRFEMAEIILNENSKLDGLSLADMRSKYKGDYLIGVVKRDDKVYIPNGDFVLRTGDKIGFFASNHDLRKLFKSLSILNKEAKNIMIAGASRTAYYLAKDLIKDCNVTIIEKNKEKCENFAKNLPDAMVIYADASNHYLLQQEGIKDMDAFIALTGNDEENILLSYYAKENGVPTVISKVDKISSIATAKKLGIDKLVSPKTLVSESIARSIRAFKNSEGTPIESLYKLMDEKAEAIEFRAKDNPLYIGIPLRDLPIRKNIIIAGIIRNQRAILPFGEDVIKPNDRVIIICAGSQINDLSDIIEKV